MYLYKCVHSAYTEKGERKTRFSSCFSLAKRGSARTAFSSPTLLCQSSFLYLVGDRFPEATRKRRLQEKPSQEKRSPSYITSSLQVRGRCFSRHDTEAQGRHNYDYTSQKMKSRRRATRSKTENVTACSAVTRKSLGTSPQYSPRIPVCVNARVRVSVCACE
jgi:hypothetical protein